MKRTKVWLCLLPVLIQAAMVQNALAEWNYTFIPTVSLGLEYDSNIFFTPSDEESDFNYQANITFPFRAVSPDTEIGLQYRTNRFQFSSTSNANHGNHFINLNVSHNFSRRLRLSVSDGFSLSKDADRVLRSGSSEGETGIIVDRVRRKSNSATATISYSLSPRTFLSLSEIHSFSRYSSSRFFDSSTDGGSLSLNYNLSSKDTLFVSASGSQSNFNRSDRELTENAVYSFIGFDSSLNPVFQLLFNNEFDESVNYAVSLGWRRHLSSTLDISFSAGMRKTQETVKVLSLGPGAGDLEFPNPLPVGSVVQFTVAGSPPLRRAVSSTGTFTIPSVSISTSGDSTRNSGLVYNASIDKTFRSASLSLTFTQDTHERTGLGGTTIRQSFGAAYDQRFSDRFSTFVNGSYDENKTESDFFPDRFNTFRVGVGSRYAITRNLASTLSWHHTEQTRDLETALTEGRRKRDLFTLVFTYAWPLLR